MRFLLDENTPQDFAVALRREGHDVVWIPETALRGSSDAAIRVLGLEDQRTLITADLEFPLQGPYPPGMILVRKIGRISTLALPSLCWRSFGRNVRTSKGSCQLLRQAMSASAVSKSISRLLTRCARNWVPFVVLSAST